MYHIGFTLVLLIAFVFAKTQTVIEMAHPGDANLILLEVKDFHDADIVIYKTDDKKEYTEWDCMWRFKKWGFSNFSVYLTNNPNDSLLNDDDMGITYAFHGKVYFTDEKDKRGYKTPGFQLEGVFRRTGSGTKEEAAQKSIMGADDE